MNLTKKKVEIIFCGKKEFSPICLCFTTRIHLCLSHIPLNDEI